MIRLTSQCRVRRFRRDSRAVIRHSRVAMWCSLRGVSMTTYRNEVLTAGDTATGSMTFMGMSAAAGLALSASAVHLTVGNFMAWDWFGAGGLHIWIAGGGMVVPDMKVSKRKACNE